MTSRPFLLQQLHPFEGNPATRAASISVSTNDDYRQG
jgi:hypothetical protein